MSTSNVRKTGNAIEPILPLNTAGDILTRDGTGLIRLGIGTALQTLRVNAGGTALEYGTPAGAGDMLLAGVQTVTGAKTFDANTFLLNDTSNNNTYTFAVSELVANRTVTLPVLAANDIFVFTAHGQILTNKTVSLANNTLTGTTADFNTALSDDTFATLTNPVTLTNKTLTTPTIASFTNATHNHSNAAGGGQITLTTGVTGTLPIANGGTGQTGSVAAFDALAPTTTKGDIIVYNGTDNIRLAVGTNGQTLAANSAQASGVEWITIAGGGDMVLASIQTVTGAKTFNSATLILAGSTSGTIEFNAIAVSGTNTITVPAETDTLVVLAATQTLTNKTLTTPTIASFTNAGHTHQNAAGGATLVATLALTATGTKDATTFLRGDDTWAVPAGSGDMVLAAIQTVTGAKTYNSGTMIYAGVTSGTTTVNATAVAGSGILTLPTGTTTLVGLITTQTLTNKTLTTPTIASFTNAAHDHTNAAGGGQLSITGATTGILTIARGGTGQTTAVAAFDALAPTTTQGDISFHNGTDNIRLAVGTALQILRVNAGATALEWATSAGGGDVTKVGTPANNQLGVWTGDGTIEGESNFLFDSATDMVFVGTNNVVTPILGTQFGNFESSRDGFNIFTISAHGTAVFPGVNSVQTRGTFASPTATQNGDTVYFMGGRGFGSTVYNTSSRATINFIATENYTDTANGTRITFETTPVTTTIRAEQATLDDTGFSLTTGRTYQINAVNVLSATTLGGAVVNSSLTSVGTIASGVWQGTTIAVDQGGTGQTSYTDGQLLIGNTSGNTLTKATLTPSSGISIANSNGAIDIATTSATEAQINTGTNAVANVKPNNLAGSHIAAQKASIQVTGGSAPLTTGDGKAYIRIPTEFVGMNLIGINIAVTVASTAGTINVQVSRGRQVAPGTIHAFVDMLSTVVTIDANEYDSKDAATPPVINTANDDVAAGDLIRIDVDSVGSGPIAVLIAEPIFRLP